MEEDQWEAPAIGAFGSLHWDVATENGGIRILRGLFGTLNHIFEQLRDVDRSKEHTPCYPENLEGLKLKPLESVGLVLQL